MPEITYVKISKLHPYDKNPRQISKEDFEKLKRDIQSDPDFFHDRPCLVNESNGKLTVYAGNQRLRAAKSIGMLEVPCIIRIEVDEKTMRSRIIKDNLHRGDWDYDILGNEWDAMDLLSWGFTEEQLTGLKEAEQIETNQEDEEPIPGDEVAAISKPGDLYELGDHRLICGDSTDPDTVQRLLDGAEPILMVTDPPYGVNYDPEWRKDLGVKSLGKVINDNESDWTFSYLLFTGSVAYVWCSSLFNHKVAKNLEDCDFSLINLIIWAKNHFAISRGDYHWQHEPCWYAVKKGNKHNWQGSRKERTVWEIQSHSALGDVTKNEEATGHSTQKPIECMARPIRNNTAEGEGVYDPFLGSGTTLIAAEQLHRKCYAVELHPSYVDMAVNRWVKYRKKNNLPTMYKRNGAELNDELK